MSNGLSGIIIYTQAEIICTNCKYRAYYWSDAAGYSDANALHVTPMVKRGRPYLECPSCHKEIFLRAGNRMRCPS